MIDVSEIKTGAIAEIQPGQAYFPPDKSEPFVGGIIHENVVAVILSETEKFEIAPPQQWDRPLGWVFDDVRYEIDETSSSLLKRGNYPEFGSLIVSGGGLWIFGHASPSSKHFVCLRKADSGIREDALAFSRWQIVRGPTDRQNVLFSKGQGVEG